MQKELNFVLNEKYTLPSPSTHSRTFGKCKLENPHLINSMYPYTNIVTANMYYYATHTHTCHSVFIHITSLSLFLFSIRVPFFFFFFFYFLNLIHFALHSTSFHLFFVCSTFFFPFLVSFWLWDASFLNMSIYACLAVRECVCVYVHFSILVTSSRYYVHIQC